MKYQTTIRGKWLMDGATTLDEAAERLESYAAQLREMAADGIELVDEITDDYGTIGTNDSELAQTYEFEENEWDDEDEE